MCEQHLTVIVACDGDYFVSFILDKYASYSISISSGFMSNSLKLANTFSGIKIRRNELE